MTVCADNVLIIQLNIILYSQNVRTLFSEEYDVILEITSLFPYDYDFILQSNITILFTVALKHCHNISTRFHCMRGIE